MKLRILFTKIFGGVGLLILTVSVFFIFWEIRFIKNAKETEGKIIRLNYEYHRKGGRYHPIVQYNYEGKVIFFRNPVGSNPAGYEVGESVQVYFNPNDTDNAQIKDFLSQWLVPAILGGIGFLFFAIAAVIKYVGYRRKKKIQWLLNYGKKVEAEYDTVKLNTSIKINNRSPYQIQSRWVDKLTNTTYIFVSDYIWFEPSVYIQNKKLIVYINPENPKEYYTDLSFLPKVGN